MIFDLLVVTSPAASERTDAFITRPMIEEGMDKNRDAVIKTPIMAEETGTDAVVDEGTVSDTLKAPVINPPLSPVTTLVPEPVSEKSGPDQNEV